MTDDRSTRRSRRSERHADGELARRSLQKVVTDQPPAPDAWALIRRRVEAGETGAMNTRLSPASTGRTGRRVLAAAAVVVALVGGLVAVRLATSDDKGVSVTTDSPLEPNGWYLPVGLPAGWHPLTVEIRRLPLRCPCRAATWSDASGDRAVELRSEGTLASDGMFDDAPGLPVDLGPGAKALLMSEDPADSDSSTRVVWQADGRTASLSATGLTTEQIFEVGRALVTDPLAGEVPVDGLEPQADRQGQELLDAQSTVVVTYRAPSGHRVDYSLRLPDHPIVRVGAEPYEETQLDGQPMPVLLGEEYSFVGSDYTDYLGRWPGATTRGGGHVGVLRDGSPNVTPEEVVTLFAALRPATTVEWRDMVAQAEKPFDGGPPDPALLMAPTLTDLLTG